MSHKKKDPNSLERRNERQFRRIQKLQAGAQESSHEIARLQGLLALEHQQATGYFLKCQQAEESGELFRQEIERLVNDRIDVDREALEAAQRDELVQQAETIGRIAGNRMDALERFYNDLEAGKYDEPGVSPYPTDLKATGLHDPDLPEEPSAPWERDLLAAEPDVEPLGAIVVDIAEGVSRARARLTTDPFRAPLAKGF